MKEEARLGVTGIPGYFYDAIVYYSSFITFSFILIFLFFGLNRLRTATQALTSFETLGLLFLILSSGYIWGQLSSALSYHVVKKPTTFIVRKFKAKHLKDYLFSYDGVVSQVDRGKILNDKVHKNYWTIIYYLQLIQPEIGSDLIKRYARCKLARVNAFNSLTLIGIGIFFKIFNIQILYINWSGYFTILSIFLILFCFEFYQRQCWFGDIIIKALSATYSVGQTKPPRSY